MIRGLLAALVVASCSQPVYAQTVANLPVTCNAAGTNCTIAQPVTNPDGSSLSVPRGGGSLATGQVSVGTSSTLIVAARSGRQQITVTVTAANGCSFGNSGVTTATGFPLQAVAGATLTLPTGTALYGVCSATTTIGYMEAF